MDVQAAGRFMSSVSGQKIGIRKSSTSTGLIFNEFIVMICELS